MRKIVLLLLLAMTTTLFAIPAKRGITKTLKTADGTTVRAQLFGDEYAHYYLAADGRAYLQQAGIAIEADARQLHERAASRRMALDKQRAHRQAIRKVGGAGKVYEGRKKGLIILVEYTDVAFEPDHDRTLFTRIANEENYSEGYFVGSVSDYFKAQSGGIFELDFDVVGPVTLAHEQAYYGGNDRYGDDKAPEEMVIEACQAVDAEVDFSDYDWDGDGEVDQVFILYAGLGEASGGDEDTVWPHEWQLSGANKSLTLDGVKIDTYACSSELTGYAFDWRGNATVTGIDGIGTICHEFSHCLGLPDMYDTNYRYYGMAQWDLMDMGSYNGDGFRPAGYTSYEKMLAGWLTPIELTGDMEVSQMKALSEGGEAYIIYNKGHNEEFYLLENRQRTGWDADLLGEGLLIVHLDYDENAWYYNTVNTAAQQRCTIIPADNSLKMVYYGGYYYVDEADVPGDPYPHQGNNQLTNTSTPRAATHHINASGNRLMDIAITDITQNADGTIAFRFSENPGFKPDPDGCCFYESFDQCTGTGGNDDLWSGNIASGAFIPDNEGWEAGSDKAFGANQCAKFGTTNLVGIATTPPITIAGPSTLRFRAAAWDAKADDTDLALQISNPNIALSETGLTMKKGAWTDYTVDLDGYGTFTLSFMAFNRFFLDEVVVSDGLTGIRQMEERPSDNLLYDLQGRRIQWTPDSPEPLPRGIYILNGKKFSVSSTK